MTHEHEYDWRWFRCSILGCGAVPLRVRRHPKVAGIWTVGLADGPVWDMAMAEPVCPYCGHALDGLARGAALPDTQARIA